MKNAEKFRKIFKEFATEVWAFPEKDFLTWLNAEYEEPTTKNSPEIDMAIKIIKADSLAPYSVDDILKARDLAIEALKQMKTAKNDLGVEEVTALAEWTEKLIKANKSAYSQGYADGMKAQKPKTGKWIEHFDESGKWYECDQCHTDWGGAVNFCPDCGADMRGEK